MTNSNAALAFIQNHYNSVKDYKFYTILQNITSREYGGEPAHKMIIYDKGGAILEYVYQQHKDVVFSYYVFHGDKANYNRPMLDSILNTTKIFD